MGTLGCINDMMRRDKENRELRKAGKERLNETRNRLIDLNKKGHSSHLSLEQLEEIRIKTQEKEESRCGTSWSTWNIWTKRGNCYVNC